MRTSKKILSLIICLLLSTALFPTVALAAPSLDLDPANSTPNTVSGSDYTFTVGDTIGLQFYATGAVWDLPFAYNVSAGSLPAGLSIISVAGPSMIVGGTCTDATSGAQSATLSLSGYEILTPITATKDITITVNKASPSISGTNTSSGTAGIVGQKTVAATIANGYFGGSTSNMQLTATITDGTNTATAAATATGANVSFDFPAAQLNTLAAGTYDIKATFAGNANNNSFAATKIGELTINAGTAGSVNPTTAAFDKHVPADVPTTLTPGSYALNEITLGGSTVAAANYTVLGNQYTFKKEYLATLGIGAQVFTFDMNAGTDPTFTVTISDSTPAPIYSGGWFPSAPAKPVPEAPKAAFPANGEALKRINVYKYEKLRTTLFRMNKGDTFTLLGIANGGKAFLIEKDGREGYIGFKDIKATFGAAIHGTALKKAAAYTLLDNGKYKRAGYYPKEQTLWIHGIEGKYLINKQTDRTYYLDAGQWRLWIPQE